MWEHRGQKRPPFAEAPRPGQESVWDYPRPPALVPDTRRVVVRAGERVIADSTCALRVLETASPPTFYLPAADVDRAALVPAAGRSFCEWKGEARYWAIEGDAEGTPVGWDYPQPTAAMAAIAGCFAFYPARVQCSVDGERVRPQRSEFYGGWVTDEIVGPFKGEPGTSGW